MMDCARRGDSRVVSLGVLLFFSTSTGDAWVLDIEEASALCLMKEHEPRNTLIEETSGTFSIGWEGSFAIDGDQFIVTYDARTIVVDGYPTGEIENTIRMATAALAQPDSAAGVRPS